MRFSIGVRGLAVCLGLAVGSLAWAHSGHGAMGDMGAMAHGAAHAPGAATEQPAAPGVTASGCWIRQLPAPVPSGGFLTVHNASHDPAVLVSAHSDAYGHVMMHKTEESGGMSRMSMVDKLTVPAGGQLEFKSGSYHLMLEEPRDGLHPGDEVQIVLDLENHTQVNVQCTVKPANTLAP